MTRSSAERTIHEVKSWPHLFEAVRLGQKFHELRRNDRRYRSGDLIILCEFFPERGEYSGRRIALEITYITSDVNPCAISASALMKGYCILSVRALNREEREAMGLPI